MKIYILLLILCTLLVPGASAYAAPIGSPDPSVDGSLVALAFGFDNILERDLKVSDANSAKTEDSTSFYARLSYKPLSFLCLYGNAGTMKFTNYFTLNNGTKYHEKYKIGFIGGGGANIFFNIMANTRIHVDNQINWWTCDIEEATVDNGGTSNEKGNITAWEYQVTGLISYRFDLEEYAHPAQGEKTYWAPYAGVKYSHLEMETDIKVDFSNSTDYIPGKRENDTKIGIVGGCDLVMPLFPNFKLNVEGRFLDDTAVSLNAMYNF